MFGLMSIKEHERQLNNIINPLKEILKSKKYEIEDLNNEISKLKELISTKFIDKTDPYFRVRTIKLPILDDPYEFLIRSDNCEPKYFFNYNTDGKERYFVHFSRLKANGDFDREMKLYGKSRPLLHKSVYKEYGEDIQEMIDNGMEELKKVQNEI